jgi:hypothetical protein
MTGADSASRRLDVQIAPVSSSYNIIKRSPFLISGKEAWQRITLRLCINGQYEYADLGGLESALGTNFLQVQLGT